MKKGTVSYPWKLVEPAFKMPIRGGKVGNRQIIQATTDWNTMPTSLKMTNPTWLLRNWYFSGPVLITGGTDRQEATVISCFLGRF